MAVVLSSATSGHADSRLEGRLPLVAVAFVHQLAAAIWLGGIPFLLLALRATPDGQRRIATCRRFSALATASVAALAVSAAVFAVVYVGSWPAVIGSDFGAMAAIKAGLFGVLLLLGLGNLRAGAHLDQAEPMRRLRAFAMAEIGIGLAVLTVAAALAVQAPPAEGGAVMAPDALVAHLTPHWPSFTAAIPTGPGTAADRAWGEMTHHWAGLLVLAMGLLALLRPLPGFGWARHWPLLFALIAIGIALLANPGSWPLGDFAFRDPGNAEAMPYRLAALLVLAFGAVEWAVQTGRLGGRAALTFPLSCGVGGFLLFTLGHPGAGGDDTLLIHLPHMAIATLGVVAGAGRWIELAGDCHSRRLAAHVWPLAFALSGAVLLLYREG
jgi:putative copper resistance protein D